MPYSEIAIEEAKALELKRHELALRSLSHGEDEHSMNSDSNHEESSDMGGLLQMLVSVTLLYIPFVS
jgi:hypothetical protein